MSRTQRVALLVGMLLVSSGADARAQVAAPSAADEARHVRVINNHGYPVRVVLVDDEGAHRSLGRVANGSVGTFAIADLANEWFRVKVFPDEPVWSAANSDEAIRTRDLRLAPGSVLNLWVEPDLSRSEVTLGR